MTAIAVLTGDTFESTISGATPVLIDFWAEWCAPCRAVAPILEEIARDNDHRLRVVKLNVDENPDVAKRLGILSIPTLILFANGEEKARIVGARAKEQLLRDIEPHL
ncbi:MAG: thioredoxin [Actinomycetota bacterium]